MHFVVAGRLDRLVTSAIAKAEDGEKNEFFVNPSRVFDPFGNTSPRLCISVARRACIVIIYGSTALAAARNSPKWRFLPIFFIVLVVSYE